MIKFIVFLLFIVSLSSANDNYSIVYKIEKGGKKLGLYSVNFKENSISTNSLGASNRLEMFSSKKITYISDGHKSIKFEKGKELYNFDVVTKMNALSAELKKSFSRKFKKVKGEEMLFITKSGKSGIELFNKRKTIIRTFDELLNDIRLSKLNYEKFILFDKLGVMKMIAKIKKSSNEIVIINASKKKGYMKITLQNNIPIQIDSLLSNWSAKAILNGELSEHKVNLNETVSKSFHAKLDENLKSALINFDKIKVKKAYYNLFGTFSLDMQSDKAYKQKILCKKLLKKSKVKFKSLKIQDDVCSAKITSKIKVKVLKKRVIKELSKQFPQLKTTKNVKFNKQSITYGVINDK